ncbi:hypothetical protein ACFYUM_34565 [Streptomyces fimicarius]|uniref:Lactococcin 972 family bacteriocin n=1 Tax=Streptomyces sp. CMC78 TaxID=3231512 RepID=A0AB33KJ83_9ACTN|nr:MULTISPECIES: hypothetical protein [unclassified Streptomyces]MDX3590261.1 hypothetical protein [Streptomyces sp. ID03-2B]MDX5576740.1 hypothetical protein [Streptomyces sp. ID01-9D]WTC89843.1 hypothetical protein OH733_25340 [Streptomyces griseus]WTD67529.1 hypothetical protein OH763_11645 [Streptomyces griseus]
MTKRRVAIALSTVGVIALVGAAPALAYQTATLSGTGQARVYDNSVTNKAVVGAWDSTSDSNPVYSSYYRSASSGTQRNVWNKQGAGTEYTSGTGSWVIKARICESQIAQPDDCSVYVAMSH